ncbi:Rhodanese-like protein, partial [Wilcoxina mikolae CBS 423.85]
DKLLIDVREPSEYAAGAIPGAINLPITSAPEALCLPEDEFEDRFGFEKPKKDVEVVFYCKAGVRSAAAAKLAVQQGYEKVAEYPGSWVEWVKKTNESAS